MTGVSRRVPQTPLQRVGVETACVLAALQARFLDGPWDEPPWSAEAWAGLLADSTVTAVIALAGRSWTPPGAQAGHPTGALAWRIVADEAEILTIGVTPGARRTGIGAALLRHGLAACAAGGAACLWLEVAEGNAPARRLYEAAGFAMRGRRKGYYRRGPRVVDALVMARTLP